MHQGWRLDPLLLFGQLLTAGAALSFGVEALRLREVIHKKEVGPGQFCLGIAIKGVLLAKPQSRCPT